MYGQTLKFNIQFPGIFKTKGMRLEQGDPWKNLFSNVVASGCKDSFKQLFNHFYPTLVSQNVKSGLSREIAAELAQEAMIRVWKEAHSFDSSKGSLNLWIYVIARNARYDYLRKLRNDPLRASSQDVYVNDLELFSEDNLDALFDMQQLKIHINKLPADQKNIIHKIYFEGLTQQEIADEDGIPLGTVKSRVRLAIAALKVFMEGISK